MTDEQMNKAIAEACGRRQKPNGEWFPDNGLTVGSQGIPDYCTDLNAMHEAEKVLAPKNWNNFSENWWIYYKLLRVNDADKAIHATSRQRAEAFLRTLGKWEPVTEESSAAQKEVQG